MPRAERRRVGRAISKRIMRAKSGERVRYDSIITTIHGPQPFRASFSPEFAAAVRGDPPRPVAAQALAATPGIRLLGCARWLFRGEAREAIDVAMEDLKRDLREMLAEGRSEAFVRRVLLWHGIIELLVALRHVIGRVIRAMLLVPTIVRWFRTR